LEEEKMALTNSWPCQEWLGDILGPAVAPSYVPSVAQLASSTAAIVSLGPASELEHTQAVGMVMWSMSGDNAAIVFTVGVAYESDTVSYRFEFFPNLNQL
jgi:hypothetical protein